MDPRACLDGCRKSRPHWDSNGPCHIEGNSYISTCVKLFYEGHLESKERFAIQRYLLVIGKKQNMQVLSHTFTYLSI